jgi:2,3-dihydroxy-p-cumate/2,3-dihydroxybenzoate 3,4-dioxygenase
MIAIEQLRYVRLGTTDLDGAVAFATRILGLELVGRDAAQAWLRSDFRDHTLVFIAGAASGQALGLEVRDAATLAAAQGALAAAGLAVTPGDAAGCAARRVKDYIAVASPGGLTLELVLRPLHSGWRYVPSRAAGITGLHGVAIRSADIAGDERLWTGLLGGRISDWVGDAVYVGLDEEHHRLSLHPSAAGGILEVRFAVAGLDELMQSAYWLGTAQVRLLHGPGRAPTSGQLFVTFAGPDGVAFSYVAEGERWRDGRRPRQFAHHRRAFCAWGSECAIGEYAGEARARPDA